MDDGVSNKILPTIEGIAESIDGIYSFDNGNLTATSTSISAWDEFNPVPLLENWGPQNLINNVIYPCTAGVNVSETPNKLAHTDDNEPAAKFTVTTNTAIVADKFVIWPRTNITGWVQSGTSIRIYRGLTIDNVSEEVYSATTTSADVDPAITGNTGIVISL